MGCDGATASQRRCQQCDSKSDKSIRWNFRTIRGSTSHLLDRVDADGPAPAEGRVRDRDPLGSAPPSDPAKS